MSELDDKPKPESQPAKSSSASIRPIFAPPGAKQAPTKPAPTPDAAPRTSQDSAAVSGEFESPERRPEPATPPRYEPPEGVTEDDEMIVTASESLSSHGNETQDDEDHDTPSDSPIEPPPPVIERPRARPPEPAEAEPTIEPSKPRPRNLVYLFGLIAVVVVAAVLVANRDPPSRAVESPPTERSREPRADPIEPVPKVESPNLEIDRAETGTETGEEVEPNKPSHPGHRAERPTNVHPRDPSVIPPGTPDENTKAFSKLPVSIHDGPPIGGIGRSGVHIDTISTAGGRDNSDCRDPTQRFSIGADEYVNVCFRVVHPRQQEWLRVLWEKDGRITRRGRVRIPDLHAYTTRTYLLVRPEYVGRWRVRIMPEGEESIDLAVAEFAITQ